MPLIEQQRPVFQFGAFELNPHTRELRKNGMKLKLPEQPLQVLLILLESPGEVVMRDELQRRLWPENTFVDFDNAIHSAVRKLRTALGDSVENPRFIETQARRGYRFIAPVNGTVQSGMGPVLEGSKQRAPIQKLWTVLAAVLVLGIAAAVFYKTYFKPSGTASDCFAASGATDQLCGVSVVAQFLARRYPGCVHLGRAGQTSFGNICQTYWSYRSGPIDVWGRR
jgi:DNA-binding winged helix-turn-helix (wHTH) protein